MAVHMLAITADRLDPGALVQAVLSAFEHGTVPGCLPRGAGAVASFVGVVRGANLGRRVLRLEYEAYEPLAQRTFQHIADDVAARWSGVQLAIHHRIGPLEVGEASVAIAAASPHRTEAFGACRYAIERVKQVAPIWKREFFEGGEVWIEGATADPDDEQARADAYRRACV